MDKFLNSVILNSYGAGAPHINSERWGNDLEKYDLIPPPPPPVLYYFHTSSITQFLFLSPINSIIAWQKFTTKPVRNNTIDKSIIDCPGTQMYQQFKTGLAVLADMFFVPVESMQPMCQHFT